MLNQRPITYRLQQRYYGFGTAHRVKVRAVTIVIGFGFDVIEEADGRIALVVNGELSHPLSTVPHNIRHAFKMFRSILIITNTVSRGSIQIQTGRTSNFMA